MEKNTPGKWVSMVNIEYRDVLEGANNKFTSGHFSKGGFFSPSKIKI